MRVITDADIDHVRLMPLALEAITYALEARQRGSLISPPRHTVPFGSLGALTFTVGGTIGQESLAGFRVYDDFGTEPEAQIVAVWAPDRRELLGLVLGRRLGELRTGAIGGVAVRRMSRLNSRIAAVIGAGSQAWTQAVAAAAVRRLDEIRVFARNPRRRAAFAESLAAALNVRAVATETAQAAVDGADIVLCATNSSTPVISAAWLAPGAHVNTVGPKLALAHEVGTDVADRAALIATDSPEQVAAYPDPFFLSGTRYLDDMVDLATLAENDLRSSTDESVTLFCSTGLAGTEVVVAGRLLDLTGNEQRAQPTSFDGALSAR
jgi:ornithine cyclodeaminase/alanine dehydrogenase-like protein (mu-crystallin family)